MIQTDSISSEQKKQSLSQFYTTKFPHLDSKMIDELFEEFDDTKINLIRQILEFYQYNDSVNLMILYYLLHTTQYQDINLFSILIQQLSHPKESLPKMEYRLAQQLLKLNSPAQSNQNTIIRIMNEKHFFNQAKADVKQEFVATLRWLQLKLANVYQDMFKQFLFLEKQIHYLKEAFLLSFLLILRIILSNNQKCVLYCLCFILIFIHIRNYVFLQFTQMKHQLNTIYTIYYKLGMLFYTKSKIEWFIYLNYFRPNMYSLANDKFGQLYQSKNEEYSAFMKQQAKFFSKNNYFYQVKQMIGLSEVINQIEINKNKGIIETNYMLILN